MHSSANAALTITIGARSSPLSQAQVKEVLSELRVHHPHVSFESIWMTTTGDRDQSTSLRGMEKTNFFTKDIDDAVLSGRCRLGIHSAKDLPEPLLQGLQLVALTPGVDAADCLVLREGSTLTSLSPGATIGTSTTRREETVRRLRHDLTFVDLRGTIGQRLQKLTSGEVDGIVVAEAALIRLGLTNLNRILLAGETAPLQGKLAVLARYDDLEMVSLFRCIDSRA